MGSILISIASILAEIESQGNLIFEALLFLRYLTKKNFVEIDEIAVLKNVSWSMQKSFVQTQAAITLSISNNSQKSWEENLAYLISGILEQKIEKLSHEQLELFTVISGKSKICKIVFKNYCSTKNEVVQQYLEGISNHSRQACFILANMETDENLSGEIVRNIFRARLIPPILKVAGLMRKNHQKWKSIVMEYLSLIRHKRIKLEVSKIFDVPSHEPSCIETEISKLKSHTKKCSNVDEILSILEQCQTLKNEQKIDSVVSLCLEKVFKIFETSVEIVKNNVEKVLKTLGYIFLVGNDSEDTVIENLVKICSAHKVRDERVKHLVRVLSLLSYAPGYEEKFRCPAALESLECAEQLEDADLLRQLLERFQLFGFGNRKCYLSLWTTLQQLICTFSNASSQLSMGSGREEEIEVLCLSVRGLGMRFESTPRIDIFICWFYILTCNKNGVIFKFLKRNALFVR